MSIGTGTLVGEGGFVENRRGDRERLMKWNHGRMNVSPNCNLILRRGVAFDVPLSRGRSSSTRVTAKVAVGGGGWTAQEG